VGYVLPSTRFDGITPTVPRHPVLWDESNMSDEGVTPLQRAVREALARSKKPRDHFDRIIQKRTGTSGKPIYDIDRGKSRSPSLETLRLIADAFELPLSFFTGAHSDGSTTPGANVIVAEGSDETVEIVKLDLSLSMGPGTLVDDYVEETVYKFDQSLLRLITRAPAHRLRLVTGIGDSMYPTLSHGDSILVDTTDRMLSRQDGIYWINLHGAAGLKRLRTVGRGRVLVKSDNPAVGDQEVDADDLRIDGRAIWYMRGL
jgi:phage repressor protein C with HTH and peptisase S24 domain